MNITATNSDKAEIMNNIRLDTALRISTLQRNLDFRDDTIEVLMDTSTIFSNAVDEAATYVEESEDFCIDGLLSILRGAQAKAREAVERADKSHKTGETD